MKFLVFRFFLLTVFGCFRKLATIIRWFCTFCFYTSRNWRGWISTCEIRENSNPQNEYIVFLRSFKSYRCLNPVIFFLRFLDLNQIAAIDVWFWLLSFDCTALKFITYSDKRLNIEVVLPSKKKIEVVLTPHF